MKTISYLAAAVGILLISFTCFAQGSKAPHQVGGFVLGDDIKNYGEKVDLSSALPIRYADYLKEVAIRDIPGFRAGLVYYGACDAPDKIVRIRLKYADSSQKFYKEVLEKITNRFGKPTEWRGDAFGAVLAWKWSLPRADGGRVSMILQHNNKDEEQSMGNTIKLTLTSQLEKERVCYLKSHPAAAEGKSGAGKDAPKRAAADWLLLLPR